MRSIKKIFILTSFIFITLSVFAKGSSNESVDIYQVVKERPSKEINKALKQDKSKSFLDHRFGQDGDSLLMVALSFGRKTDVVQLLLDWGVDPDFVNNNGDTALTYAAKYGADVKSIKAIVNYEATPARKKARVAQANKRGQTALDFVRGGSAEQKFLLKYVDKGKKAVVKATMPAEKDKKSKKGKWADDNQDYSSEDMSIAGLVAAPDIPVTPDIPDTIEEETEDEDIAEAPESTEDEEVIDEVAESTDSTTESAVIDEGFVMAPASAEAVVDPELLVEAPEPPGPERFKRTDLYVPPEEEDEEDESEPATEYAAKPLSEPTNEYTSKPSPKSEPIQDAELAKKYTEPEPEPKTSAAQSMPKQESKPLSKSEPVQDAELAKKYTEPEPEPILITPEMLSSKAAAEKSIQTRRDPNKRMYLFEGLEAFETYDDSVKPFTPIAEPNARGKNGRTLLQKAAAEDDTAMIDRLLKSGADVNMTDNDNWTALMYAARFAKKRSTITALLNAGADIMAKNKIGATAIRIAATHGQNAEVVDEIAKNLRKANLVPSFIAAVGLGRDGKILKVFFKYGISPNTVYKGKTPLMHAAERNTNTNTIQFLLANGSDKTYLTADRKDAFYFASQNPNLPRNNIYWSLNNSGN